MKSIVCGILMCLITSPASAQSVRGAITASNGVQVTTYTDSFANRKELSSPEIDTGQGFVLVTKVVQPGDSAPIQLRGAVIYRGEYRNYSHAIFRGGEPATFRHAGQQVSGCSRSLAYPGCSFVERFHIDLPDSAIADHGGAESLEIQIRAQDASTLMIVVPARFIDAVIEAAN